MPDSALIPSLDLSACARGPIHIPGSIQPHGLLFVLDGPEYTILQVSENIANHVGVPAAEALGKRLVDVLPRSKDLAAALSAANFTDAAVYIGTLEMAGSKFRALAHRLSTCIILELELAPSAIDVSFQELDPVIRRFVGDLGAVERSKK